jgi:hypothetical protein
VTLHRRGTVTEAMLYAFDLLELDGQDLRNLPLGDRKKRLARLLGGRRLGIVLTDHTDEDGATIFRQACVMGLEGIVSKRLTAPYRSGPSRDWLKVKNPDSPAMIRARKPSGDVMAEPPRRFPAQWRTLGGGETRNLSKAFIVYGALKRHPIERRFEEHSSERRLARVCMRRWQHHSPPIPADRQASSG